MKVHLRPIEAVVLDFPNTQEENLLAMEAQLTNLLVNLRHKHGERAARMMFAEAAIAVIATDARVHNCETAMAFALEITIERELIPQAWRA